MYTDMEMWRDIRGKVVVEGVSKREICRSYGIHFKTLQKILSHSEPPGYRMKEARSKPKIGPFISIIEQIVSDDRHPDVPKKQRHTAKRIFERLRDEHGYDGGYTAVKEVVRACKQRSAEVFVPLSHPPGWAQVDFGHAWIYLAGERTKVAQFVMALPFSDVYFVCAFERECTESFQEGHQRAFEFFGGVPTHISYDNTSIAVAHIGKGRERTLTREFLRLQSHYHFEAHFCLVRRPNEKGHVEGGVGYTRRNFFVPMPRVERMAQLNGDLTQRCFSELSRVLRGKEHSKGELLQQESAFMLPLPAGRFEAHRVEETKANSLSLVRFDRNDYSIPTRYAHQQVTAIGTIDEVRLVVDTCLVATHQRCWKKHRTLYEPIHYLALLERKPGALDFARPLEQWELPTCFDLLRRRLESDMDGHKGVREYIKVLRLLETATVAQLAQAIEYALFIGANNVDAVRLILEHRTQTPPTLFSLDGRPHLQWVQVPDIDLQGYGLLLGGEQ